MFFSAFCGKKDYIVDGASLQGYGEKQEKYDKDVRRSTHAMKENIKTIIFAVVLAVVCSALLTGMKIATRQRQEANKLAFQRENILRVLNVELSAKPKSEEINELYEKNIIPENDNGLELYKYLVDGKVQAVAVGFEGPGLWNKIKGYLALDDKMEIIKGITFYEHEETPGLGGEIDKQWFKEQFIGKPFKDASGHLSIKVVKPGMASNENEINGISGATITGSKVQDMLSKLCDEMESKKQ